MSNLGNHKDDFNLSSQAFLTSFESLITNQMIQRERRTTIQLKTEVNVLKTLEDAVQELKSFVKIDRPEKNPHETECVAIKIEEQPCDSQEDQTFVRAKLDEMPAT